MIDKLRSYGAATKVIENADRQECNRRWVNNRAENSHQPFRRLERAVQRFRRMSTLQEFTCVHAVFYNHFNHESYLTSRDAFKLYRAAAMVEWKLLAS